MNEDDLPPAEEHSLLIAEYALGVLSADERMQVEELLRQDPAHRELLAAWQRHFADWLTEFPAVEPPARVWLGLQQRLFPEEELPAEPPRQWNNPRLWRWTTAIALAASLVLAVLVVLRPAQVPAPTLLARLEQNDGNLLFSVTVQHEGRQVLFVPTGKVAWQDRSAQAWVIAADGKPRSLGLLPAGAAAVLPVPAELAAALSGGAVLAVSLEPPGGSPTGLPTGPVIAQGKITSL
ncbi:TPA: anti-sigma factor [Pseudomonas aeruginosa]|nr:anti-sigma factor [Pseudomonas aeruginosa]